MVLNTLKSTVPYLAQIKSGVLYSAQIKGKEDSVLEQHVLSKSKLIFTCSARCGPCIIISDKKLALGAE